MSFGPLDLDSIDRAGQPLEGLSQHSPGEKIKIRLKFNYYILSIIKVNLAKRGNHANLHYEEPNGCWSKEVDQIHGLKATECSIINCKQFVFIHYPGVAIKLFYFASLFSLFFFFHNRRESKVDAVLLQAIERLISPTRGLLKNFSILFC